jgi:hypothetical protein
VPIPTDNKVNRRRQKLLLNTTYSLVLFNVQRYQDPSSWSDVCTERSVHVRNWEDPGAVELNGLTYCRSIPADLAAASLTWVRTSVCTMPAVTLHIGQGEVTEPQNHSNDDVSAPTRQSRRRWHPQRRLDLSV